MSATPPSRWPRLSRWLARYKVFAVVVFNTALLLAVVNVVLHYGFKVYDKNPYVPLYDEYGEELIAKAYPGMSKADRDQLLTEIWLQDFEFQPFIQYREKKLRAKFTNTSEYGFRFIKDQGPWPPPADSILVYVLGGSTTFGYGVADDQTIPSYLQEYLREHLQSAVHVYNFGHAGFYSSQERILLQQLMVSDCGPHVAVFLDGINEVAHADDEPDHTGLLRDWMDETRRPEVAREQVLSDLPMVRAARALRDRMGARPPRRPEADPNVDYAAIFRQAVETTLGQYVRNLQLIDGLCAVDGIRPLFVWQPAPCYHHSPEHQMFASKDHYRTDGAYYGYREMARRYHERPAGFPANFLWLAELPRQYHEPLYVDAWHYTARFNKEIAARIGQHLIERKIVERPANGPRQGTNP